MTDIFSTSPRSDKPVGAAHMQLRRVIVYSVSLQDRFVLGHKAVEVAARCLVDRPAQRTLFSELSAPGVVIVWVSGISFPFLRLNAASPSWYTAVSSITGSRRCLSASTAPTGDQSRIRRKMLANTAPEMLCHTEKMAPGTVAIVRFGNAVAAREVARPEFCIPISMESAFFLVSGSFKRIPSRYPQT